MNQPRIVAPDAPVLVDERLTILLQNLEQFQHVTVRAELTSDKGEIYESFGHYIAGSTGEVNLVKDPSFGGSYTGTDSMGLFWSMAAAPGQRKGLRYTARNVEVPMKFVLQLFDGYVTSADSEIWKDRKHLATKTVLRTYLSPHVERKEIRVGRLRGTLFHPKRPGRFPGVIDMFGTHGGLLEYRAALLASHGFASFALAFYNYKDLPTVITDVELEYFIEAVEWFSKHDKVYTNGIGYMGVSYGGQIALQVAAECRLVKAVVAISSPASLLTPVKYKNELIGFQGDVKETDIEIRDGCLYLKTCFDNYPELMLENLIKFENIAAQVMAITGADDQSIRATEYAMQMQKLMIGNTKGGFVHLSYPKTGHLIEPPFMPTTSISFHGFVKYLCCWGGDTIQHSAAQEHAWQNIIRFFKNILVEPPNNKL